MKQDILERIRNKEVTLFAMSGKMASGKDTVGKIVQERLEAEGFYFNSISFGQLIKEEVEEVINNIEDQSKEAVELRAILGDYSIHERSQNSRRALQYWGTNVRREENYNYWIEKMEKYIIEKMSAGISIILTDVRFPNEADLVFDIGGKVVRLHVPREVRIQRIIDRDGLTPTIENLNHPSELALDHYGFEQVFNGTKKKEGLASEIIDYIMEDY